MVNSTFNTVKIFQNIIGLFNEPENSRKHARSGRARARRLGNEAHRKYPGEGSFWSAIEGEEKLDMGGSVSSIGVNQFCGVVVVVVVLEAISKVGGYKEKGRRSIWHQMGLTVRYIRPGQGYERKKLRHRLYFQIGKNHYGPNRALDFHYWYGRSLQSYTGPSATMGP
ncbi:hypothetical protein BKA93DRAFT_745693 [Sparassis latifolia]